MGPNNLDAFTYFMQAGALKATHADESINMTENYRLILLALFSHAVELARDHISQNRSTKGRNARRWRGPVGQASLGLRFPTSVLSG